MPEGDTIFRAARLLDRALAGRVVTRFESTFPAVTRVDHDHPVAGTTIDAVRSRGKHLLMMFSGDLVLHTHMRMNGSWHIYGSGERWRRPAADMRVLVATRDRVAVGFNVPIVELLTRRQLDRHPDMRRLGPDPLDPSFDSDEVRRRIRSHDAGPIGDVLLNQRVISGIGNVLKAEILFVGRINPFALVAALDDADLNRLISVARHLMTVNVQDRSSTSGMPMGRRTTGSLDPNAKLWVYGRGGQRCRKCGTAIEARKTGLDARLTYWCPRCQPGG